MIPDHLLQQLADADTPDAVMEVLSTNGVVVETEDAPDVGEPEPQIPAEPELPEEPLDISEPVGDLKLKSAERAFKRAGLKMSEGEPDADE